MRLIRIYTKNAFLLLKTRLCSYKIVLRYQLSPFLCSIYSFISEQLLVLHYNYKIVEFLSAFKNFNFQKTQAPFI